MSDRAAPPRRIPVARPSLGPEEEAAVREVLRSGWVTQGPRVAEFEAAFAERVGAREAVAVSSGTAALFLALHASGIGAGDEVVVPSLSFIASANAIVHCGATPVFADVDPRTYNLDRDAVEAALSPRTKAILVVHQLGMPADLDPIEALAAERGLAVIEDAACAVGSRYRGRPVGSSGNLACFSFHPRKVVVVGEGGMVTVEDADLAARMRRLRHQGMSVSDLERHNAPQVVIEEYPEVGYNLRMSDIHAAVGIAQLAKLDALLRRRRTVAERYAKGFAGIDALGLPEAPDYAEPNFQSYIVRLRGASGADRDRLMQALQERGVASRRGLMASHRERCYAGARLGGRLEHTERAADQTLLLPIYPDLSEEDQAYVVAVVRALLGGRA